MATKIKNIPFVGGDTATFEFDFGTKVKGSVVECPMKMYWSGATSILTPTSKGTDSKIAFVDIDSFADGQNYFNTLKSQDGVCMPNTNVNTSEAIAQLMVELDLTPLCNSLFGGSNSAMKAAMKIIDVYGYAKGAGKDGTSVAMTKWANGGAQWSGGATNNTNQVAFLHEYCNNNADCQWFTTTDNKFYVLFYASASNGTIPSEVDLDYINIKIQFARVPDVINLLPIKFPSTWSMLIKGFSPAWDSNSVNGIKFLLGIDQSEHANYDVSYQGGKFVFDNWDGSTAENLWSDPINLTKFQTVNLLIEQTATGRRMRILKNQGNVLKYSITSSRNFPGDKQMGVLMHVSGLYQADAFLNSIVFMPNKVFDNDTEAEAVLRGITEGFEEDELFDISKVGLHSNAKTQNDSIVLNATSQWQNSTLCIPVLPNNQYLLNIDTAGASAYVNTHYYINNVEISRTYSHTNAIINIPDICNKIMLELGYGGNGAGTVVFSNMSFKLKM